MKKLLFGLLMAVVAQTSFAQTLEKMQWFNEPEQWEIKDKTLSMFVTPQSDYWRISHYGFTVDDAPFYYSVYGGEFEAKVGGMAACPDGDGFKVKFENFKVKHLPDMRRVDWLKKNAE